MGSFRWWLLGLTTLGCGNAAEPNGILVGRWGSVGDTPALLIGLGVAAELQLGCSSVRINKPLTLAPDNTFDFTGTLRTSVLESPEPRARVQGHWLGDVVTLEFDILDDELPSSSYTLERGVDPRFDNQPPPCPQAN